MMGYYGAGMAGWMWIVNALFTIVFWGGLIALGVWLVRRFTGERVGGDSADEILRRRLAAGEITPEEFERLRTTLRS
jgi:putative membrane protein